MSIKKWFTIPAGTVLCDGHITTSAFTFGFVQEERENDYLLRCKYGQLYVPKSVVQPYTMMDFKRALSMLEEFSSHHCRRGQFQFNIKFYNWNVSPKVKGHFSDEVISREFDFILENELRNLVDKKWCDGCLPDDFDWIKDWHTDGRMGGWLVLSHVNGDSVDADSFHNEWQDYKEQELEALEYMEQPDYDPEQAQDDLDYARKGMREIEDAAIDLAIDLALIEDIIDYQKEQLKDYLLTDDPWLNLIETLDEEEEKPKTVECPLCGCDMHYERVDQDHVWKCSGVHCRAKLMN